MTKVGFAGLEQPSSIFPTCIGYPRYTQTIFDNEMKDYYIGNELMKRGLMNCEYPIQYGEIRDWEIMRKIWEYIFFSELRINPTEHALLLTEPPFNPNKNREKIAEIMFEDFDVPALSLKNQSLLALYATGRNTGCVVDIGEDGIYIVPFIEGYVVTGSIVKNDLAGRDIIEYLKRLLKLKGEKFETSLEFEILRKIKEVYCYIAENYNDELERAKSDKDFKKIITRPSGKQISITHECFTAPEILFQPNLSNKVSAPLHLAVVNSITECPDDTQSALFGNIVLSGGTTMLPGFQKRLKKEIEKELERRGYTIGDKVKIEAPEERMNLVWLGGSMLASQTRFLSSVLTKHQWREQGPEILHRK